RPPVAVPTRRNGTPCAGACHLRGGGRGGGRRVGRARDRQREAALLPRAGGPDGAVAHALDQAGLRPARDTGSRPVARHDRREPMNGARALLSTLVDAGVDVCFANPGTSEMHFVAALDDVPAMRGVLALFEGVATGAADGYARVAGRPAATLLHLGPGL